MKIKELLKTNILNEMASTCLNRRVDDNFYDYYFEKETNWLFENKDKIIDDFYKLDKTFEINNNLLYYTINFSEEDILDILK